MNEFMLTQASIALASFSAVLVLLPNTLLSLPHSALSPPKTGIIARVQHLRTLLLKTSLVRECFERMELRRQRMHCLRELPCLLDVVILGLSAGLSFDASLELYCTHYKGELSALFRETMMLWRLGVHSKRDALLELSARLRVSALTRFVSSVVQALECGSPLVVILANQAQCIRDEQRSQLEEEIEKVPVKMLIPMGVFVVPAMLIAILGPLIASAPAS